MNISETLNYQNPALEANRAIMPKAKKEINYQDSLFKKLLLIPALGLSLLLILIGIFLLKGAWPAIYKFGLGFIGHSTWDPVQENFGALPVIFGTVASAFIALLISTPFSIGVALFLTEIAPNRLGKLIGFLVEMLAAIPSVVYGLWGIFVLAPNLRTSVEPFLQKYFGFLPFFQGPPFGVGMLAAGLILAIMITPTITTICREVFKTIPRIQKEAATALGATTWEMMKLTILNSARKGIFGAVILGLGRALGETMAVTMVIGNRAAISASLFSPSQTMASLIANEYAEATSDMHVAALIEAGLALFLVTFLINLAARMLVWRSNRKW